MTKAVVRNIWGSHLLTAGYFSRIHTLERKVDVHSGKGKAARQILPVSHSAADESHTSCIGLAEQYNSWPSNNTTEGLAGELVAGNASYFSFSSVKPHGSSTPPDGFVSASAEFSFRKLSAEPF